MVLVSEEIFLTAIFHIIGPRLCQRDFFCVLLCCLFYGFPIFVLNDRDVLEYMTPERHKQKKGQGKNTL